LLHFKDISSKFYKKRNSLNSQLTFYKTNRMTFHTNYLLQLNIPFSSNFEFIIFVNIIKVIDYYIRKHLIDINEQQNTRIKVNDENVITILQNEIIKNKVCNAIKTFMYKYENPENIYVNRCFTDVVFDINYYPTEDSYQTDTIERMFWDNFIEMNNFLQTLKLQKKSTFIGKMLKMFR